MILEVLSVVAMFALGVSLIILARNSDWAEDLKKRAAEKEKQKASKN